MTKKKLTTRQTGLLRHLGTYRLLTGEQVAVLQSVGLQASRKRLRELVAQGRLRGATKVTAVGEAVLGVSIVLVRRV